MAKKLNPFPIMKDCHYLTFSKLPTFNKPAQFYPAPKPKLINSLWKTAIPKTA